MSSQKEASSAALAARKAVFQRLFAIRCRAEEIGSLIAADIATGGIGIGATDVIGIACAHARLAVAVESRSGTDSACVAIGTRSA